jgi:hypothetical protein
MQNDFTRSLLNYSAERDDCIGRPERWGNPPPLVVTTPLHQEMEALAQEIWSGAVRPVWYFLVGGPGNGKSEAVGAFVRKINLAAQTAGLAPVFDHTKGQHGGSINYWFPGTTPKGDITLLQDISVPKNSGSDPAADLLASLELCANPGSHMLGCANRGMLLRATRLARNTNQLLVPILEWIDAQSQEGAEAAASRKVIAFAGKEIELRVWPLDHESVLYGEGNGNPWAEPNGSLLDQIIKEAIAEKNWEQEGCAECPARNMCPMFGDVLWLRDADRRRGTLKILRHAEVFSGQRVVLREALGLVSMILVGCPSDFVEGGQELHPCEWVQRRLQGTPSVPKDWHALLDLISHRIYQDLFGRQAPTALSLDRAHQRRDKWICEALKALGPLGISITSALDSVDDAFAKQAGPQRLVGKDGILSSFDPAKDIVWCARHNVSADGNIQELKLLGGTYGLEQHLGDRLVEVEAAALALEPHKGPAKVLAGIYRWASALYLRIKGTTLGENPNSAVLEDYLKLLQQPSKPIDAAGQQTNLRDLMMKSAADSGRMAVAPGFSAGITPLQPKSSGARARSNAPRWPANDRLTLRVLPITSSGPSELLTASTFVDTWRRHVLEVADWNISPAMENLMQAWRNDFVISQAKFRDLPSVDFDGNPTLEFEFISGSEIQVRQK